MSNLNKADWQRETLHNASQNDGVPSVDELMTKCGHGKVHVRNMVLEVIERARKQGLLWDSETQAFTLVATATTTPVSTYSESGGGSRPTEESLTDAMLTLAITG